MPSYQYRKVELERRLEEIKAKISEDEYKKISAFIPELANARDSAMTTILTLAGDDDDEFLKSEYDSRRDTVRGTIRDNVAAMLNGIDKPSEEGFFFRAQVAVEEDFFFRSLEQLHLGELHDDLIILQIRFAKSLENLKKEWETTKEASSVVLQLERDASAALQKLMTEAIDQGVPSFARLGDAGYRILEWCSKIGDKINDAMVAGLKAAGVSGEYAKMIARISEPGKDTFAKAKELGIPAKEMAAALPFLTRDAGMVVTDALKDISGPLLGAIITILGEGRKSLYPWLSGAYVDAVSRMTGQLPNHGKIQVAFSETRRATDEFIKKNNAETAVSIIRDEKERLRAWADGLPTDAMQRDTRDLAEGIGSGLDKRLNKIQQKYADFVRENDGVFVGDVRSETVEALLSPSESEQRLNAFLGLNFSSQLKDWDEKCMKVTGVVEDAWTQIQDKMAPLPVDTQYYVKSKINDVMSPLKRQIEVDPIGWTKFRPFLDGAAG